MATLQAPNRWLIVAVVATLLGAVLFGLLLPNRPTPSSGDAVRDFGLVFIDEGPQELLAEFPVWNTSIRSIEVVDVITTCGCLEARLESRRIPPGDKTTLTMRMLLNAPGNRSESTSVVFADSRRADFTIRASGAVRESLKAFVGGAPVENRWEVEVLLLTYETQTDPPKMTIDAPPGVVATDIVWETIQITSGEAGHPSRFAGSFHVTTSEPTAVVIRSDSGLRTEINLTDL